MTTIKDKILEIHKPKPRYKIIKEISSRFSPRYYSEDKIPKKDLNRIFEAARLAPSAHNEQPWQFYYAVKGSTTYNKLFSTLDPYNQSWAKTAPLLILSCAIVAGSHGENPYAIYDLGAANLSLILQAQSLGYYSRQMALFDKGKTIKFFKLEKNIIPYIVIAMGKLGDYEKAPKEIIDHELSPRPRKTSFVKELI